MGFCILEGLSPGPVRKAHGMTDPEDPFPACRDNQVLLCTKPLDKDPRAVGPG